MYNSKIVDKKEILRARTVSNTGIYCSSDTVGTVCNKCSKIPPSTSMYINVHSNSSISETDRNTTHVNITFLLRMTDTMTSQNIDLSSLDTLYIGKLPWVYKSMINVRLPETKYLTWHNMSFNRRHGNSNEFS